MLRMLYIEGISVFLELFMPVRLRMIKIRFLENFVELGQTIDGPDSFFIGLAEFL